MLRFSSKISGAFASECGTKGYINEVTSLAKAHFGSRIHAWDESFDQRGYYSWPDVHASVRSYAQSDEPKMMPTSIAESESGTDSTSELDIPLFEIEHTPDKGRRLVARSNIPRGTRILMEKPLLTVRIARPELLENMVASKLKTLSKPQQRQFLSLHNNFPGKHPFSGITRTNALPCGSGSPIGGIYPTICLINHSCLPNAHNNWNSEQEQETIHAIRPIPAGEEITIAYDMKGSSAVRRSHLQAAFGFDCSCVVCTLPLSELRLSDARRVRIQQLDEAIGDLSRMMSDPAASLRDCKALLVLSEEEYGLGAAPLHMRMYYDAFQIAVAHSDQARAALFAHRAHECRVVCDGEDSPQTKRMALFRDNPSQHDNFRGCSKAWETKRQSMPRGITSGELETWWDFEEARADAVKMRDKVVEWCTGKYTIGSQSVGIVDVILLPNQLRKYMFGDGDTEEWNATNFTQAFHLARVTGDTIDLIYQLGMELLYPEKESIFEAEEEKHPWRPRYHQKFDKPLLRIWDCMSGSQPTAADYMMARDTRMRLDNASVRKSSLTKHLDHKVWVPGPYIFFTSSPLAIDEIARMITNPRRPGKKTLTAINPNIRVKNGLPVLPVLDEMEHYGIEDPYHYGKTLYANHYVCLWQVTPPEIVRHWDWETISGDENWYKNTVLPAFEKHEKHNQQLDAELSSALDKLSLHNHEEASCRKASIEEEVDVSGELEELNGSFMEEREYVGDAGSVERPGVHRSLL
ncbi:hypothetical protein PWT90_06632 [Aphanocladium album]|nr:hypothetical protein PWT90_06632 [Aphanocladium album]